MEFQDTTEVTSGYQGTDGYTAPEVSKEACNPFFADVWSAGRVVYEILLLLHRDEATPFLMRLSKKMMDDNPSNRPSILDAKSVQWMTVLYTL